MELMKIEATTTLHYSSNVKRSLFLLVGCILILSLVLLVIQGLATPSKAFADPPVEPASISGTVTNVEGAPIPDVRLIAYAMPPTVNTYRYEVFTDANGYYRIPALVPGDYEVFFWPSDILYLRQFYGGTTTGTGATVITLEPGENLTGLDIQLPYNHLGQFSGHITSLEGAPLASCQVLMYRFDGTSTWTWTGQTSTDKAGNYTMIQVPPGIYKVYFTMYTTGYVPEYYDDVSTFEDALPITVVAGQTLSGIDAQISTPYVPPPVGDPGSGDLDGDGATTVTDAVAILRYIAGLPPELTAAQLAAADMDGDLTLTITDSIMVLRKVAGL
jgi:hypothetical protein